ncbi:MAG: hypothetical protein QHH01_04150 [Spirochaetales bacterium]|nr:hypothetical protein [Spirochaetales bacterium]
MKQEALKPGGLLRGILPDSMVTVVSVLHDGEDCVELTYKDSKNRVSNQLLFRVDEARLSLVDEGPLMVIRWR